MRSSVLGVSVGVSKTMRVLTFSRADSTINISFMSGLVVVGPGVGPAAKNIALLIMTP